VLGTFITKSEEGAGVCESYESEGVKENIDFSNFKVRIYA